MPLPPITNPDFKSQVEMNREGGKGALVSNGSGSSNNANINQSAANNTNVVTVGKTITGAAALEVNGPIAVGVKFPTVPAGSAIQEIGAEINDELTAIGHNIERPLILNNYNNLVNNVVAGKSTPQDLLNYVGNHPEFAPQDWSNIYAMIQKGTATPEDIAFYKQHYPSDFPLPPVEAVKSISSITGNAVANTGIQV